jgi:hypothetical protein
MVSSESKYLEFSVNCFIQKQCFYLIENVEIWWNLINPLTPNDPYSGRIAPLTSKRCILYNYSTKIGTEYFKHGIYSPFFLLKMHFVS